MDRGVPARPGTRTAGQNINFSFSFLLNDGHLEVVVGEGESGEGGEAGEGGGAQADDGVVAQVQLRQGHQAWSEKLI